MEAYLAAHGSESEDEDNGMMHLGKGFYLYETLYHSLYAHQQEGVLWLWSLYRRNKGGILGDDMGLGKTIQVIAFLSGMFDMQKIQTVLIVLPVALMVNWEKELQKWAPGLKVVAFHGNSKREKERALHRVQKRGGICLTTYGLVVTSWEMMGQKDGREFVWDYMILDEGHKIKNPTKTSKGVHAIPAQHRIILTGTPVQNNLKELWALFDFVHQGSLLGTQRTFKMEFENPITRAREKDATVGEKRLGLEMAETLKGMIAPYFLRRTKAEVKLREQHAQSTDNQDQAKHAVMPSMTRKNDLIVWTFLGETQLNIYQDFLSLDSVKELLMTSKSPLVALTVLKKICDHPRLLSTRACAQLGIDQDDGVDEDMLETETGSLSAVTRIQHIPDDTLIQESGKLVFLVQLLDRLRTEGHRCLVFSQSRRMLDIMQKVISNKGHKIMRLDGTISSVQEREQRIQKFQTDASYGVFLLTTQVGGVGLTLTAADRVVIYDPSWNPATDAQAVDRVFRIGQDKNVVIYRLITCGTVEEKIYRRQIFKDSITRQTTGTAKNPYRYFSKYELRELFTLDDPKASSTQQQLEAMHSGQRLTDPSLDEHIAYLYSLEMFGLSDHDLMFSQGGEAGVDEEDVDPELAVTDPETDYIQSRAQKARELIQMESSQGNPLEVRLGKGPQQGSVAGRLGNQFQNWDIPKTGVPKHEEEDDEPESPVEQHVDLTAQSPVLKVEKEPTLHPNKQFVDLTTPPVQVKKEAPMDHSGDEGAERQIGNNPPTPLRIPHTQSVGGTNLWAKFEQQKSSHDSDMNSPEKAHFNPPKVKDKSLDSDKRHAQVLTSSIASISSINIPNQKDFRPMLSSTTIFGAIESPDVQHTSSLSGRSNRSVSASSAGQSMLVEDSPGSPARQPLQPLVQDSPANTSRHRQHTGSSHHSAGANVSNEDDTRQEDGSVVIDDSVIVSDDEEKENIEPGNISVNDIRGILEKSLHSHKGHNSFSVVESPIVTKPRRKSTAYQRRVIESSDEDDTSTSDTERPSEALQLDESNNAGYANHEMVHESSNEADEESYEASEENNEGVADQGMDVEDGDAVSQRGVSEDRFSSVDKSAHGRTNSDNVENNYDTEHEHGAKVCDGMDEVEHGEELEEECDYEEDEDLEESQELEEFARLPVEDQIQYNELVEKSRSYCQARDYEMGLACVLQALEIYQDEELQSTAMLIQRKVLRRQNRQPH
ncbi:DNA excision repair protein ERCC-6-like isoform X2 [Dreissena polymorpha]|nr:DNA excision repair protein ERCC-6-like isoform X2 [Dreissena polymorpha]